MNRLEFWEAFARIAETLSPLPLGFIQDEFMTQEIRINFPLAIKMEALLYTLYSAMDRQIKEELKIQPISEFNE